MDPVKSTDTEFGKVSYLDFGTGEAVLLAHGILGGYGQAFVSLTQILGDECRKLAPSRFGYPSSSLPSTPTPGNQAKAYVALLDKVGIQQTFVIASSAGGAAGIKLALNYPERIKGLILLSSGVPTAKRSREEISQIQGAPALLINDFPMWFTVKYLKFALNSMFGSTVAKDLYETMLPVRPRKPGIEADITITNLDMDINYDNYPVEKITVPILIVHAKDDAMAKFQGVEKFIARVHPQTSLFATGGHLITGHGDEVSKSIKRFMEATAAAEERD
ncbi:alpha/beta fold hydrolase [Desulforamulus ruminis]|uniref:Alpha/beta hydrolase fold protein n=1 Tax=Desulforamulus ruminis (strain ATCC 23193 / DSM 2154 / NCIMB 8452 / DL) TaxID=696281 RepID=F6DST0_DESRL|nr:alpha/beta hydrolase [Desulforamulus ruminis]AEG58899.1 alpha/beta hydrolase fold protein [Desulforamulus ruminis DSM 2154]